MGVGDWYQSQAGIYHDADGADSQGYTCQCDGFWTLDGDWRQGQLIVSYLSQQAYFLGSALISGVSKIFVSTFDDLTTFEDTVT